MRTATIFGWAIGSVQIAAILFVIWLMEIDGRSPRDTQFFDSRPHDCTADTRANLKYLSFVRPGQSFCVYGEWCIRRNVEGTSAVIFINPKAIVTEDEGVLFGRAGCHKRSFTYTVPHNMPPGPTLMKIRLRYFMNVLARPVVELPDVLLDVRR